MEERTSAPWRACVVVIVAVALLCGAGIASAAVDKNASYQEMLSLAQQMKSLKPQVAVDAQAAAAYAVAESRYRDLSAALGGDDPGHMMNGAAVASTRSARTKVVPTTPAGCGPATATFTQSTPTAIPTGPAVVTSTVVVSGAGPYLFDLDLTTNLTHTFAADLDITLMSPAGTIVTLTTDNGAGNDNVFNGTLWDDDANPAGQVPYTTNAGLVTDHPYVNLTTATPLVVEEAMGAFIGENPNGTWTITISDDLAGDGGSLDSWSLAVTTFPSAPTTATTTATQSTPTAIPTGPAVVTSTLVVAGAGTSILDVDLTTFITHTFAADLDITLTSPAGTVVTLTTDNGAGNDNVFNGTVWDDDANPAGQVPYTTNNGLVTDHAYVNLTLASPLVPEEAMAAFIGEDPNGTWTITISDDLAGDGGSLDSWSLNIDTFSCATLADLSITKTDGVTTATPGGTVTYTITAANAGPSAATGATVTDTFPAELTGCTWTCVGAGGGTCTAAGSGNISDTVNLPAGGSVTYTATCTVSTCNPFTNNATVAPPAAVTDPDPANNSATDVDTVTPQADLSITKTDGSATATAGGPIVYTIVASNAGACNAPGATVTDTFPADLTGCTWTCAGAGGGTCTAAGAGNIGDTVNLPVGGSATYTATCTVALTACTSGTVTNTATVVPPTAVPDPTPANNSATDTDTVTGPACGGGFTPEIPTLSPAGLLLLVAAMAVLALLLLRRRRLS